MSDNNDIKLLLAGLSKKLDSQFTDIKSVQKEHGTKLHSMDLTLAKQEKELTHHIKIYNDLKKDFKDHQKTSNDQFHTINDDFKPIQAHVNLVGTLAKWTVGGSLGVGGIYALIKVIETVLKVI